MAYTTFPNSAVCYILADIPGDGEFQATGVIIGPHTILTAAHVVWDADVGQSADAVSIYPGYQSNGSDYNPPGALGGTQAIHYIKVQDQNGELDGAGTEHDFAVIDTSVNLTQYGHFALNYGFTSGDLILLGYPAVDNGTQSGTGGVLAADSAYSDIDTQRLTAISPGYSGGPLYDEISNGRGATVDAVAGLVSTDDFATKINRKKVGIIANWVKSDSALWTGQGSPSGKVVPQIASTVDSATLAASLSAPGSGSGLATASASVKADAGAGEFATMVDILHQTQSAATDTSLSTTTAAPSWLANQYGWLDPHEQHHYATMTKA